MRAASHQDNWLTDMEDIASMYDGMVYYGISAVMGLWCGLRLQRLVIEFDRPGTWFGEPAERRMSVDERASQRWEISWFFNEAAAFIERGKGWREVVLNHPEMVYSAKSAGQMLSCSRKKLRARDEGATVEKFVTDNRGETLETDEAWESEKGIKVWAGTVEYKIRRGEGTEYTQDCETEDAFDQQLIEIFRSRNWKQIREEGLYVEEGTG